jgi:hypothetical protein
MVRRCSVGSASACWKAGPSSILGSAPHWGTVFPTELTSDEEMERGLGKLRRINVLYECDWMNVCMLKKIKIKDTFLKGQLRDIALIPFIQDTD